MKRRKVVFVNRFYYPDHSATAQILTDLAEALAARDWDVKVMTSRTRYDDASVTLPREERRNGVDIRRFATTRFGRKNLAGRAVDYLSFYLIAFFATLRQLTRGDIIVAKTDPPLVSIPVAIAAWVRGAILVNWLQDLYPEVAAELGVETMRGPIGRLLRSIRNLSLRGAGMNVAIGERMAERLLAEGIPATRIAIVPNWSDETQVRPLASGDNGLRDEWSLRDRFVVGYSGNLGRAHEFETILGAATALRERSDILFLVIGGGHMNDLLAERVAAAGLDGMFQFRPYQARDRLSESLGVADIHWLSLRPELEGLIMPSKFYGIAAAGRAVIAVTDRDGEIARIVERHRCGLVVLPGDASDLARRISELADDPVQVQTMGNAARTVVERQYTRAAAIDRWDGVLSGVHNRIAISGYSRTDDGGVPPATSQR